MAVLEDKSARSALITEAMSLSAPMERPRLPRRFRKRDAIALVVSNVIGVGIFTTPAVIASLAPSPAAMLGIWIVGGILALAGASCYARLAALWPSAGGEYVYLSRAYGPMAGFLSGWTSLIAGFSGAVATSAVAAVIFAGRYFPTLSSNHSLFSSNFLGLTFTISYRTLGAALLIGVFAALHILSLGVGKRIQNALAVFLVGLLVVFLVRGFTAGHGTWLNYRAPHQPVAPVNFLLALIPVMFTYSGWNAAVYISEEIRAPRRSIRPILLIGTGIVVALYLALNALYLYALTPAQIRGSLNVADAAAQTLFAGRSSLITPVLILGLIGAVSAMTIAGPRVDDYLLDEV